jgi:preprotein translocase subunit SecG
MFTFLLVVQGIVAAALIGVILMQKSEGGGLGTGGSPAGFLSARGAADFLTRATSVLATLFVLLCVALAVIASLRHNSTQIDASAANGLPAAPVTQGAVPVQGVPTQGAVAPAQGQPAAPAAAPANAPTDAPANKGVPLQQ